MAIGVSEWVGESDMNTKPGDGGHGGPIDPEAASTVSARNRHLLPARMTCPTCGCPNVLTDCAQLLTADHAPSTKGDGDGGS